MALATALLIASAITVSRASGKDMGFTALVGVIIPLLIAVFMVRQDRLPRRRAVVDHLQRRGRHADLVLLPRHRSRNICRARRSRCSTCSKTVLAPVWVWLIFSEAPSRNALIGGTILIVALVAHSLWQLTEGRRRKAVTAVRHPA